MHGETGGLSGAGRPSTRTAGLREFASGCTDDPSRRGHRSSPPRSREEPELSKQAAKEVMARMLAPPLLRALHPFQRKGIATGLQRGGRILLADEMGVGKTVQAICLAACYQVRAPGRPLGGEGGRGSGGCVCMKC